MKIAIAQMNPVVGDTRNNALKALEVALRAKSLGATLVIFPELFLCGYPPKDLLLRSDFMAEVLKDLHFLAKNLAIAALIGSPYPQAQGQKPYNAAILLDKGELKVAAKKRLLPNYNVFDEKRYFDTPAHKACEVITFEGQRFLISICEDAWNGSPFNEPKPYGFDPVALGFQENSPVDLFINISASPYAMFKPKLRESIFCGIAHTFKTPALVAGQVGANDQLLFDGHSLIINEKGRVVARAKACEEDLLIYDSAAIPPSAAQARPDSLLLLRDAIAMGIRDYVEKCGAPGVLLGLSGGIDSAVCASLAVLALGKDRVKAVFLPSKYSSSTSRKDASDLAMNLGLTLETIAIQPAVDLLGTELASAWSKSPAYLRDIAEQNLQARVRGIMLMGISNANAHLLMATSNKSELAVGYSTLYGDMCGAFSPIGDIYKTDVWRLAHAINEDKHYIPDAIIDKAPSAELKANQRDDDTLPDYTILDQILRLFIDEDEGALAIEKRTGIDLALINQIIMLTMRSEYKRRQAPFAFMVSEKVFGDARRQPIAARWAAQRLPSVP